MPLLATNVKTREIVPYLPCLTQTDREEIEAKRETSGNYMAMQTLLDCLRKRQNWPEEFISALEACEHSTMAAEVRAQYDSVRAPNNPNPSSPPTTVVTAHVHPAPPAAHPVATPERNGNTPATPPPPEPVTQASPPPEPAPNPPAEAPKAVPSPEHVPQPPQSPQTKVATPPSTPPPSLEPARRQAATPPPPQRGINTQQEPEENSEMDLQQVSGGQDPVPDKAEGEVLVVNSPEPRRPVEQVDRAVPSLPHPVQTTIMEDRAPQILPPAQTTPTKTAGSAYSTKTPERPPVQETVPPVNKVATAVLQPEETSEPAATQVVQNSQQTRTTDTPRPPTGIHGMAASPSDDENDVCLSKPGQLLSMQQNLNRPPVPASNLPEVPYSGDSARLQISEPPPPRQENGVVAESLQHNEPEENHYESVCQSSLGEQEVLVMHVAEEPSIQNQDGQTFRPPAQILNGKATTEPDSAPLPNTADTVSSLNAASGENCHLSGSAPHDAEVKMSPTSASAKYYLTAAGVGVCALLMAWKFKK